MIVSLAGDALKLLVKCLQQYGGHSHRTFQTFVASIQLGRLGWHVGMHLLQVHCPRSQDVGGEGWGLWLVAFGARVRVGSYA